MTQKELHEKLKELKLKAKNVDPEIILQMCKRLKEIKEKKCTFQVTDKQLYKSMDL